MGWDPMEVYILIEVRRDGFDSAQAPLRCQRCMSTNSGTALPCDGCTCSIVYYENTGVPIHSQTKENSESVKLQAVVGIGSREVSSCYF